MDGALAPAGWARAGPPPAGNLKACHLGPASTAARARFWAAYQLPGRAGAEGTAVVAAAAAASAGAPALSIGLQHRSTHWVRAARARRQPCMWRVVQQRGPWTARAVDRGYGVGTGLWCGCSGELVSLRRWVS